MVTKRMPCKYEKIASFFQIRDSRGFQVGPLVTSGMAHCQCDRLSIFASGLQYLAKSSNMNLSDFTVYNKKLTVFIAILLTLISWLGVVLWANYQDRQDIIKVL